MDVDVSITSGVYDFLTNVEVSSSSVSHINMYISKFYTDI